MYHLESQNDADSRLARVVSGKCAGKFQYRRAILIWIQEEQSLYVLVVGAGGCCFEIFSLACHFFSSFFLSSL